MGKWQPVHTVIVVCFSVVTLALVAAFVLTVTVGNVDPDVVFRFIAGPAIGNLIMSTVAAYTAINAVRLKKVETVVKNVQEQTNGHLTALTNAKTVTEPASVVHDSAEYSPMKPEEKK